MRVTFILPPVNMSGGIRVAAVYAEALARNGHQVTLVSPAQPPIKLRSRVRSFLSGEGWPRNQEFRSHLDGRGLNHRVLERYRPVMDEDVPDADIVIATWWETAEWVNALSRRKGEKIYFVQHHEIFEHLPVERCRATYRMPLRKIVIARWLADVMRDEYGDANVDLVPNAVDRQQFHADVRGKQNVPTVGFLYHETHFKGMDVVLAALAKIRRSFPNLRAICFGSHPPSTGFRLDDFVEFHLEPPQDRLRDLYRQCDVWLAASRSEGFNLTAMEAMSCRVPVVSTRTGWPEEAIVAGQNGVLVDVDDIDGIVDGAVWVLGLDDKAWRAISEYAYQTVADSSWENSARLFEQALMKACQGLAGR
jgi:glycosyltransferase involved in cell wall biosynthesis